VDEPGPFKDRVDTAWSEISYGVVRAVSIGFRPIKYAFKEDGGIEFQEIEIYELSSVSVPALPEAVITSVKSMHGGALPQDVVQAIKAHDARLPEKKNGGYVIRPIRQEVKTLRNPDGSFRLRGQ
jgi:phage head maturation protease